MDNKAKTKANSADNNNNNNNNNKNNNNNNNTNKKNDSKIKVFVPKFEEAMEKRKQKKETEEKIETEQKEISQAFLHPSNMNFKPPTRLYRSNRSPAIPPQPTVPAFSNNNNNNINIKEESKDNTSPVQVKKQESFQDPYKVATKELIFDSSNPNHPSELPFVDSHLKKFETNDEIAKESLFSRLTKEAGEMETEGLASPEIPMPSEQIPTPLTYKENFLNEDNLFFLQLPSSLPFVQAKGTLQGINGHLGKICVYRSGKVKLKIGDHLFDVTAANNPKFLEELMVITDKSCFRVGPMTQHLVVTPDLESLLAQ